MLKLWCNASFIDGGFHCVEWNQWLYTLREPVPWLQGNWSLCLRYCDMPTLDILYLSSLPRKSLMITIGPKGVRIIEMFRVTEVYSHYICPHDANCKFEWATKHWAALKLKCLRQRLFLLSLEMWALINVDMRPINTWSFTLYLVAVSLPRFRENS